MSNHKTYRIKLTKEEREAFAQVAKGKRGRLKIAAWKVQRANAMLMCDEGDHGPGWTDEKIAEAFGTTTRSLENWRKQAALQGPLSLLERKQRATPPTPPILDGDKEALLTKIACSTPPDGRSRWTLQMLADELVALEIVDSISADTVGRAQKKTTFRLIIGFSRFGLLTFGAGGVVFFRATLPHDDVAMSCGDLAWWRRSKPERKEIFTAENSRMARVGIEGRD